MAQAFQSNQGTQTNLLVDTTGGTSSAGTSIPVMKLDISALGTFTKSWDGNMQGGTIGSVVGIGSVGGLSNLPGGTINLTQTVSTVSMLSAGTLTTIPNIPGGTINILAGGTLGILTNGTISSSGTTTGVGTVSNLGSITSIGQVYNAGTLQTGANTIGNIGTLNIGTVVGKDANAAAQTGNPISIGGTDSGGTVRTVLVNSAGALSVTGASAGTFVNISTGTLTSGSLSNVAMLNAGTITTLPNIPGGSIVVTTGTVVNNGGSAIAYGPAAAAAAAVGNPLNIGGTDSGGTIRSILVDATGVQRSSGSMVMTVGTVSVLPNIPGGTLNILAGGTLGLINTVTSVTGLASGTVNVGTFVNNGGTVAQLTNGSIVVTAGTVRADARTTQNVITFGTSYGTSASGASTIIGSAAVGAGTSVWVNDFSILNNNGNITCVLGFGTAQQGTNVLFRGSLGTAGAIGIEKVYSKAVNAGMTNQDLVFSLTGAGTVDLSVSYFISA